MEIFLLFQFGQTQLDIDVERTRAFYDTGKAICTPCACPGCRNFAKARGFFPEEVREFFHRLGVDPENPAEVTAFNSNDGNMTLYNAFYHLCGTMLSCGNSWIEDSPGCFQLELKDVHKLSDNFTIYFAEGCGLVHDDFPRPVVQMEMEFEIPWLLEEANPYGC